MDRLLRILTLTWRTYLRTRASTRAAALSFSSLLGLGPLIALIVIIGTPILGHRDPYLAARAVNHLLHLIAPQIHQYEEVNDASSAASAQAFNPKLTEIINSFVTGAHRSTLGFFGALSLLVIVILLFESIEASFNDIWNVRAHRTLFRSIAFHALFLLAGAILFFSAAALLSVGTFLNVFFARMGAGPESFRLVRWALPIASFAFLAVILAFVYRLIPNTTVRWRPAVIGALVVTVLLLFNNFLAFFYLHRVLLTRSLYGSLGVVPILMIGLYIFWVFVLIGGQISYAVQSEGSNSGPPL